MTVHAGAGIIPRLTGEAVRRLGRGCPAGGRAGATQTPGGLRGARLVLGWRAFLVLSSQPPWEADGWERPEAAAPKYHQLGGLQPQTFILPLF